MGKLDQVRQAAQRTPASHDDRNLGRHGIGPLRRDRANLAILEAQQEPLASPVPPHADPDGPLPGMWVERVGDRDKLPHGQRIAYILN